MYDIGSAKAGFNCILDSLVLPGNTDDPSDCAEDLLCSRRTRARPSVLSGLGRNDARNFEAELEEQENLGVVIDNLSKSLDD